MSRLFTASLLALAATAVALPTRTAEAQCSPGSVFCAEVHIGGSVRIGPPAPPPPPRTQVYVVHEPAPPPPPVVVYEPAPPPTTTVVYAEAQPQPQRVYYDVEPMQIGMGLHGQIGGMLSDTVQMGGAAGAFRIRPNDGHLAVDLGIGAYGGRDYNGNDRVEVPLTADLLLFVNPESRLQLYGVAGVGLSFAHTETPGYDPYFDDNARDYAYVGGQLGAGLELRLSRWFAINGDLRGFVRERVDSEPEPEFVADDGRTTDTSGGMLLNLGATVYF